MHCSMLYELFDWNMLDMAQEQNHADNKKYKMDPCIVIQYICALINHYTVNLYRIYLSTPKVNLSAKIVLLVFWYLPLNTSEQ